MFCFFVSFWVSLSQSRSFLSSGFWVAFDAYDVDCINDKCNDNRIVLMAVHLLGNNFASEWNGPQYGWSTSRMMHAVCRLYETKCIPHANWWCGALRSLVCRAVRCARFLSICFCNFKWKSIYLWQREREKMYTFKFCCSKWNFRLLEIKYPQLVFVCQQHRVFNCYFMMTFCEMG